MKKDIRYKPVGGINLMIKPPGHWFDSPDYHAFLGGCGVGQAKSLKEAESILLDRVKDRLTQRLLEAEKAVAMYRRALSCLALKRKANPQ